MPTIDLCEKVFKKPEINAAYSHLCKHHNNRAVKARGISSHHTRRGRWQFPYHSIPISRSRSSYNSINDSNSNPPVGGRLRLFYQKWSDFTSDPFILEVIKGHKIEFGQTIHTLQRTKPFILHKTIQKLRALIWKLINFSLRSDRTMLSTAGGLMSNFFTRSKKNGGTRLILDLFRIESESYDPTFQNGKHSHSNIFVDSELLFSLSRSTGCILLCPYRQTPPEILEFHMAFKANAGNLKPYLMAWALHQGYSPRLWNRGVCPFTRKRTDSYRLSGWYLIVGESRRQVVFGNQKHYTNSQWIGVQSSSW